VAAPLEQPLPSWRDGPIVRRLISVDHKQIGILYLAVAGFFLVGLGIDRLLWFLDAAHVPSGLLGAYAERQVLAFQGTTVLFHVGLPATLGLASFLVPLQVGSRRIAWPQLNALAFWLYLAGASMMLPSRRATRARRAPPCRCRRRGSRSGSPG